MSSPTCPARVSFAGSVLPSGPSPCSGLSPPPSTMPDKTPQEFIVVTHPPGAWFSGRVLGSSLVPFLSFLIIASLTVYHHSVVPTSGTHWGFPSSPTLLFLHATVCGLRRTFTPSPFRVLSCGLRCTLKPSASATTHFEAVPALQGARHPYGLQDALSTLRLSCSPLLRLRHRRKTRYEWVANSYQTGNHTPQDTPSFAWHNNASNELRGRGDMLTQDR